MDKVVIRAKLNALLKNVRDQIKIPRWQYFDPKFVMNLFNQYSKIRDKLISEDSENFDDLVVRDLPEIKKTSDHEGRGNILRHDLEFLGHDIEYCLIVLSRTQEAQIPPLSVTREGVFFTGQEYDAIRKVGDILSKAQKSIMIIDGYINEEVLDMLTSKQKTISVNVLTFNVEPPVRTVATRFNKQCGNLSIRTSKAFHDRFVIVDDSDFYHFGHSIKDLGTRGFMFSRIEEPEVIDALRRKSIEEWGKAKQEI